LACVCVLVRPSATSVSVPVRMVLWSCVTRPCHTDSVGICGMGTKSQICVDHSRGAFRFCCRERDRAICLERVGSTWFGFTIFGVVYVDLELLFSLFLVRPRRVSTR
jgi:hypothetical protein